MNPSIKFFIPVSASILLLLISCGKADKRQMGPVNENVQQNKTIEAASMDPYGTGNTGSGGITRFDYSKALQNPRTSKLAREIFYNTEKWNLSDNDNAALALLDSLTADNAEYRPFYFKIVTTTYPAAEGLYADALGYMGTNYVLNSTHEFLDYFTGEQAFSRNDLKSWAGIVMLEISKTTEENLLKAVSDFNAGLNAKAYDPAQRRILDAFTAELHQQAEDLLKKNDE